MEDFTVEFNVEEEKQTSDWVTYRRFIEDLRNRLRVRFSHNLPVLPLQENPPTHWFDIVLQTKSHSITLKIRRDNLYLDGYRIETSTQWLEFGSDTTNPPSPHLIVGSSFLGFDGGYNDLERASGEKMDKINLGQQQFTTAVNQLATSTDRKSRARSLIIVIQMTSESIRFQRISNHLATTFRSGSPPPDWMLALEHGWEVLSATLLRADANPMYYFRLPQPNAMQIVTAEQAVDALGILLGFCFRPNALERVPQMVINDGQCVQGRPLVEVFAVRINKIDEKDPGNLYGTITVTDGLGSQNIYDRKKENYESIRPGENALLTGPARAISAYGSFAINVALMIKDKSSDDEISNGQISWNVFNTTNQYNKLLNYNVDGKYGSVTVNYVVLNDAVQATVEVTLINGDGENPANVYGLLTARNSNFTSESVLFQKTSKENIDVKPKQLIPLSRSVVAVPLNSSLLVRADLKDHDTISSSDEIAKGTIEFPAQLSGTSEKNISGKYGEIRVKVTWSWDI